MRRIREGEVPYGAGTAVQDDPGRPVFRGNGPDDYICVECGNVLAVAMGADHMDFKVRVKCGRCRTVNVADTDEAADRERWRAMKGKGGGAT
jgi:phage FluMu protein Com